MWTMFDFSPLIRSSVGFDRVFDLLETAARVQHADNWPPYDIVKTGDDQYTINMAVAGFSQDELTLTMQPNQESSAAISTMKRPASICIAASRSEPSSAASSWPTM